MKEMLHKRTDISNIATTVKALIAPIEDVIKNN